MRTIRNTENAQCAHQNILMTNKKTIFLSIPNKSINPRLLCWTCSSRIKYNGQQQNTAIIRYYCCRPAPRTNVAGWSSRQRGVLPVYDVECIHNALRGANSRRSSSVTWRHQPRRRPESHWDANRCAMTTHATECPSVANGCNGLGVSRCALRVLLSGSCRAKRKRTCVECLAAPMPARSRD